MISQVRNVTCWPSLSLSPRTTSRHMVPWSFTRRAYGLTLFSSVNLISLWATNVLCWGCPGGACCGVEGCWADFPPVEGFEDLGGCVDESLFLFSSLMPSSFLDFPADEKCLVMVTDLAQWFPACHLMEGCVISQVMGVQGCN